MRKTNLPMLVSIFNTQGESPRSGARLRTSFADNEETRVGVYDGSALQWLLEGD